MKSFENKVAAITGAGSGIGRALALALAEQGCNLALSDIDEDTLAETARLADRPGILITRQGLNVADRDAVHSWAEKVVRDHGKINLVFNNAGVLHGGAIDSTSYSDYDWIIDINLRGVIYGTKAFLPLLKQAPDGGHIVNISSIFGILAQPGMSGYNTTKFAVRGFTESLRQELDMEGCDVSATSVHPGGIKTNIMRSARMQPEMAALLGQEGEDRSAQDAFIEKLFMTEADKAAGRILTAVRRNARRALVGGDARVMDLTQRIMPSLYQRLVTFILRRNGGRLDDTGKPVPETDA